MQHVVRQLIDRQLLRGRHHRIGQSGIAHQRVAAQRHAAGRRHQAAADIAKAVAVEADRHVGLGDDALGADDVGNSATDESLSMITIGVGCTAA